MSIGTRLRQLRKANNLSGDMFGELCGVTKGMVSQWESGTTTPPTDRLLELHKKLDFSFDWLLGGEDSGASYSTTDPTLVEIMKVLEPQADYLKSAAHKAVVNTVELADKAKEHTTPDDVVKIKVIAQDVRRAMAANHKPPDVQKRRKDDAA